MWIGTGLMNCLAWSCFLGIKPANAERTGKVAGRKTDQSDSEWLAQLLRSELIEACYAPGREIRVLRELTRLRTKMIQNRTDYRNRVHKVLQRCNIRLDSKLCSVFGRAGMEVLEGLMDGESLEEIADHSRSELGGVIRDSLDEEEFFVLKWCLRMIEQLDEMSGSWM